MRCPLPGKPPFHNITRGDPLAAIAKIEQRGALMTADKVRTWLNQLVRYALMIVEYLHLKQSYVRHHTDRLLTRAYSECVERRK